MRGCSVFPPQTWMQGWQAEHSHTVKSAVDTRTQAGADACSTLFNSGLLILLNCVLTCIFSLMQMKHCCNHLALSDGKKKERKKKCQTDKQGTWKPNADSVSWFLAQAPSEVLLLTGTNNGRARLLHTHPNWDKNTDLGREIRGKEGGFMLICVLLGRGSGEGRRFDFSGQRTVWVDNLLWFSLCEANTFCVSGFLNICL